MHLFFKKMLKNPIILLGLVILGLVLVNKYVKLKERLNGLSSMKFRVNNISPKQGINNTYILNLTRLGMNCKLNWECTKYEDNRWKCIPSVVNDKTEGGNSCAKHYGYKGLTKDSNAIYVYGDLPKIKNGEDLVTRGVCSLDIKDKLLRVENIKKGIFKIDAKYEDIEIPYENCKYFQIVKGMGNTLERVKYKPGSITDVVKIMSPSLKNISKLTKKCIGDYCDEI